MRRTPATLSLVVAACGGPSAPPAPIAQPAAPVVAAQGPDCEQVVDRVQALVPTIPASARREGIAECELEPWSATFRQCLLDVDSASDVTDCVEANLDSAIRDVRLSEAEVNLHELSRRARTYVTGHAAFPVAASPLTPATACCTGPDRMCAADPAPWAQAAWAELAFTVDDAHRFRYSYQSDGKTMVALAVGDLDCDGVEVTYRLDGTIVDGQPAFAVTAPVDAD